MCCSRSKILILAAIVCAADPALHALIQAPAQSAPSSPIKVYVVGGDVTAPELLPVTPIETVSGKCRDSDTGKTILSFIVDEGGTPRNITFLKVTGNNVDRLAL